MSVYLHSFTVIQHFVFGLNSLEWEENQIVILHRVRVSWQRNWWYLLVLFHNLPISILGDCTLSIQSNHYRRFYFWLLSFLTNATSRAIFTRVATFFVTLLFFTFSLGQIMSLFDLNNGFLIVVIRCLGIKALIWNHLFLFSRFVHASVERVLIGYNRIVFVIV